MRCVIFFIVLFIHGAAWGFEKVYPFDSVQNGFIKLLPYEKSVYVITKRGLYKIGAEALELKANFPAACTDACAYQDGFALATDSGLLTYSVPHGVLKKLLPEQIRTPVNHVVTDAKKRLWFSLPHEGAYVMENSNVHLKVQAPVLYALAATPDSNVWAGTNLGLYKIPASGSEVIRYAEEGIEGFELPDNIVESLFADAASNIWVLMPDNLAFVPGMKSEGEVPSYKYPGGSDNKIFDIIHLPFSTKAFLFATAQGIIYTNNLNSMQTIHTGEIHQVYHQTAYVVPDSVLEKPVELAGMPVLSISIIKHETWFVTSKGIWALSAKKLVKRLGATP